MDFYSIRDTIFELGHIDDSLVDSISMLIYEDGIVDTEEINHLFELNDIVSGKENSPRWKELFIKAVTQGVLEDEESPGVIDDDESAFIKNKIGNDGVVDDIELELLVNILEHATACSNSFIAYSLSCLHEAIVEDGLIDDEEVALIRRYIFSNARSTGIDIEEVVFLFGLNDACDPSENCDGWSVLFTEAIADYVLNDPESPGEIDEREAEFLLEQLWGDGEIDSVEMDLLRHLKAHAKSYPESLANLFTQVGV
jgi:hypothetical protein